MFQIHKENIATSYDSIKPVEDCNINFKNRTASFNHDACGSFAIIDIGSNSVRLCIFNAGSKDGELNQKLVETTQLGEGFASTLEIQKLPMQRTLNALKNFVEIAKKANVLAIYPFATATVREATNRDCFLNECKSFGLEIHILSEEEEALCGFLGVAASSFSCENSTLEHAENLEKQNSENIDKDICIFDIGGASFEIAIGKMTDFTPLFPSSSHLPTHAEIAEKSKGTDMLFLSKYLSVSKSFKVGAVRMTDQFGEDFTSLASYLFEIFENESLKIHPKKINCFGIGGTITSLAGLVNGTNNFHPSLHGFACSKSELSSLAIKIQNMNKQQRENLPHLKDKRKKIIAAGSQILLSAMEFYKIEEITASLTDNVEGYKFYLGI